MAEQDSQWALPTEEDLKAEREGGVDMTKIAERIETIVLSPSQLAIIFILSWIISK